MSKSYTLGELASLVGGELKGDPDCVINRISTIEHAALDSITFLSNTKYKKYLSTTSAAAVILRREDLIGEDCHNELPTESCCQNLLITPNPYLLYAKISALFSGEPNISKGVHKRSFIGKGCEISETASIAENVSISNNCKIGNNVFIYPGVVIGESVSIGDNTIIKPNASIMDGTEIGSSCIIHAGVVIGSDGFGFANDGHKWQKISQLGRVIIRDNVEIGANTTIDRGAIDDTVINSGVKLDNLIQIAHNVFIGENTAIAAGVAIAGSTTIGSNCTIAGKVGVVGHISLCDNCHITAMSLVTKSITKPGVYSASMPAVESKLWHKMVAKIRKVARK